MSLRNFFCLGSNSALVCRVIVDMMGSPDKIFRPSVPFAAVSRSSNLWQASMCSRLRVNLLEERLQGRGDVVVSLRHPFGKRSSTCCPIFPPRTCPCVDEKTITVIHSADTCRFVSLRGGFVPLTCTYPYLAQHLRPCPCAGEPPLSLPRSGLETEYHALSTTGLKPHMIG